MYEILVVSITAVFGLCAGSFLNVCIWRLPREGLSVSKPRRSFCPSCEAKISWRDNIPVLSWLLLRGRCRACEKPISIRYPLVELLTAAVCALVVWRFHLQIQLGVLEQQPGLGVVVSCIALLVLDRAQAPGKACGKDAARCKTELGGQPCGIVSFQRNV